MADRNQAGLRRARRFGLEIGGGCIALALFLAWRGTQPTLRVVLLGAGAVLLLVTLVRPALLAGIANAWLTVGERIAAFTTPVFVAILYVVVVTPIGIARRRLARSPIRRDPAAPSYWVRREPSTAETRRKAMEHQF